MNTSSGAHHHRRLSPVDGSLTWSGNWASADQVAEACARTIQAFPKWSAVPLEIRIQIVKAYAAFLESHTDEIARTITLESGKPLWESQQEVRASIAKVANAIDAIQKRRWTWTEDNAQVRSRIAFQPLGSIVVLGPYNLPLHLPGAHIIPALLAGNTIVFKPSEKSPAVGDWIGKGWKAAGLNEGVLELIPGGAEQAKWAIAVDSTAGVLFTGSYAAGLAIHQSLAGRPQVLLALEMGGNNPLVIDRVKDRPAAIATVLQSAFITSGQRCTCARRLIIIDHPQNSSFVDELSQTIHRIAVGHPLQDPQPFMGTLVSEQAATQMLTAINELQSNDHQVLNEMRTVHGNPAMLTAGLLIRGPNAKPSDEEHFGPMLVVEKAPTLEAAIDIANQTQYGLAAGLLSDDASAFELFRNRIRAGIVNWNSPTTGASGKLPFGGIGSSGNHRPSGYFASDYCSYPVASTENQTLSLPSSLPPGLEQAFSNG